MAVWIGWMAASCGYVGDPQPPALNLPSPVQDLRATQVEDALEIVFTIPSMTTENLPVKELGGVELLVGAAPEGGWDESGWAAAAQRIPVAATAPGPAKANAPVNGFVGREVSIAVRLTNRKGRTAGWSNRVSLAVEAPPVTSKRFVADSAPEGAVIRWEGFAGKVAVFRDGAKVGEGQKGEFLDRTAGVGKAYKYSIEALGEKARGRRSDEVELIVADRFPPTVPSGVNAVAGAGTIELSWNTNTEPDLAGYQLERREGDSEWTVAAASVDVPGYSDRAVVSGRRYRYRVSALDGRGNRSVPSQVVEITAP